MPEKDISFHEQLQVHPFHHHAPTAPGTYPSLQFPSAFVAFHTPPAAAAAAHVPLTGSATLLDHNQQFDMIGFSARNVNHRPQIPSTQEHHPHSHMHNAAQPLPTHDPSRYLWDPTGVASNFHHPSAHG